MTLNYVTLTLDGYYPGGGSPAPALDTGFALFTPSVQLTDPGVQWTPPAPVQAVFRKAGGPPSVQLLATDNSGPVPAGWGWTVTFEGVPGNPAPFSFFLPFSGGSSQNLSALSPVSSAVTMQAYLPLPTGTPSSGQVPIATGIGEASAWGSVTPVVRPSGDATGVTDAANINAAVTALPSKGGTITLAPTAAWYINCGSVVINRSGVYLDAPGVYINAVGTGDVIRMYDSSGTFWPVYGGGITGNPVIDGTSAGAGSAGIHMGDLLQAVCEASVQNFTGAGSMGVHFDNANYWTEQLYGRIYAKNCTQHVVFDVTGATTSASSFGRASLQVYVDQIAASQDGLVLQNGAQIYDGDLILRGNFMGSASALTSAVLRVTGTVPAGHPFAGSFAQINNCRVEVGCEINSGFAHVPATMLFGANGNVISNCYGILDYAGGSGTFAASTRIGNIFPFNGAIRGDSGLQFGAQGFQSGATWNASGGLALGDFSTATTIGTGGTISSSKALERVTTTGAVTGVILGAGSFDGQQLYIVNESGNSITFAASGTSHVADGASDVIAAHAGATFIFEGNDTNLWYRC